MGSGCDTSRKRLAVTARGMPSVGAVLADGMRCTGVFLFASALLGDIVAAHGCMLARALAIELPRTSWARRRRTRFGLRMDVLAPLAVRVASVPPSPPHPGDR